MIEVFQQFVEKYSCNLHKNCKYYKKKLKWFPKYHSGIEVGIKISVNFKKISVF